MTRPLGKPIEHSSIPFALGYIGSKVGENLHTVTDIIDRDLTAISDTVSDTVAITRIMAGLTNQMAGASADLNHTMTDIAAAIGTVRDDSSNLADFLAPIKNYFYWDPHCFDIPACWAFRSFFDMLDQFDHLADDMQENVTSTGTIAAVTPQLSQQITVLGTKLLDMRKTLLTIQSAARALIPQLQTMTRTMQDVGQAFDNARNDDFFYLAPDAFDNPDFQVDLKFYVSPDGKAARIFIYHRGEALSSEGIARDEAIYAATKECVKGTTLNDATMYMGGAVPTYWDVRDGARDLLHHQLHWLVMPISFIILVGVGSDYNLLLISRIKEEFHAGLNTGLVRAVGSTGQVVTTAGLVFAFTMLAKLASDLRSIGQVGTTICIGLLLDTLIVRSFIVPAIVALLGRWFWWPVKPPPPPHRRHPTSPKAIR